MSSKLLGVFAFAALWLAAGPAVADCKPLSLVASVDLAPTDDLRPFVPVTLSGRPKLMLIDTGGVATVLTQQAADELGLKPTQGMLELSDIAGRKTSKLVHSPLTLGRLSAQNMSFYVLPDDHAIDEPNTAGIIAPDVLSNYDVEIDFGSRKFNLLSQDHCEGKVVYWPTEFVAIIPFLKMNSGHIQFKVMLDGKDVVADFDTGAYVTTLTRSVAVDDLGITVGGADTPRVGSLTDSADAAVYTHVFKSLDLGGVAVSNLNVVIIPDMTRTVRRRAAAPPVGYRLSDKRGDEADQAMLLGMNILRHLHIYIAYNEQKIYITAAGPSPAAPSPHATP